jgi:hypothetical protein
MHPFRYDIETGVMEKQVINKGDLVILVKFIAMRRSTLLLIQHLTLGDTTYCVPEVLIALFRSIDLGETAFEL